MTAAARLRCTGLPEATPVARRWTR
jgi:hypothetical protein